MMDKSLFKLKGIKITMSFLVVMALLQALTTILQAKYLAETVTNLFNGEKLSGQLLPILLFFLFYLGKQWLILFREKRMTLFQQK